MGFKIVEGDLIEMAKNGEFDVIAHGCNCFKLMGAGIAKQIKQNFIEAYIADLNKSNIFEQRLGSFSVAGHRLDNGKDLFIFNLYTQFEPGKNFELSALRSALKQMNLCTYNNDKIGLPLIGCGIGGGNWDDVEPVIREELSDRDVTIVKYKT